MWPIFPHLHAPRTHGRNVVESLHEPLRKYVRAWLREGHTLQITATIGPTKDSVDIQRVDEVTNGSNEDA
jgi:hypothetical protein